MLLRRVFSKTQSTAGLEIPRFYFPHGKPYTSLDVEKGMCKIKAEFDKLPGKCVASKLDMGRITKACGLPLSWKEPLKQAVLSFAKMDDKIGDKKTSASVDTAKEFPRIHCEDFLDFWKKTLSSCYDDASRFVKIMTKAKRNYIVSEDFIPMIQDVVECHPGLTFLKEASEFHSRYVHTVRETVHSSVYVTNYACHVSLLLHISFMLSNTIDVILLIDFYTLCLGKSLCPNIDNLC